MTRQEVGKLIYAMKSLYVGHFRNYTERDFAAMVSAWGAVLEDVGYAEAERALKEYARSDKGFPPTTGQLYEHIDRERRHREIIQITKDLGLHISDSDKRLLEVSDD